MGARRVASVAALLTAAVAMPTVPAETATPRCTIVGTRHADRLFGSRRADVLCGRGGDDHIFAAGGDDLVYGGAGDDVVYADQGEDRVFGGRGDDHVEGSYGADDLRGGAGDDIVDGQGAHDTVYGGPGDDDLWGWSVTGGPGADYCPTHDYWPANRCDRDRVPVTVESVTLSPPTVDVTSQRVVVTVDVRMTDDIGLREVAILVTRPDGSTITPAWVDGSLRSGTPRDGIWRMRLPVPKAAIPDDYEVRMQYIARVGVDFVLVRQAATLHVTDRDPDQDGPSVVEVASPAPDATVSLADPPVVRMHVTDDASGVRAVTVAVYPSPGVGHTVPANRVEGTVLDGWWDVPLLLDGLSVGDHAAIVVGLQDKAGRSSWYVAPSWSWWLGQPGYSPLPGGVGDFVVGP